MKKILLVVMVLAAFCVKANAQFFVSGTAGFQYRDKTFSMLLLPGLGYEFSDRWAVGTGVGFGVYDDRGRGVVDPYVRFNCWNNDKVFVDLKATSQITFGDNYTTAFVGLAPSLRYAVNNHLQLSADFGAFGVDINDGEASPAIGLTLSGIDLTVIYRF